MARVWSSAIPFTHARAEYQLTAISLLGDALQERNIFNTTVRRQLSITMAPR
jgi:hypothetical protein